MAVLLSDLVIRALVACESMSLHSPWRSPPVLTATDHAGGAVEKAANYHSLALTTASAKSAGVLDESSGSRESHAA